MKVRPLLLPLIFVFLSSCTFSLAEDVTPPPNYVPPTPMPTLGPLYPAEAPNIENGAAIYAGKCAPCHGERGMGDGPDGKQLPVTVAALGLPQVARAASPADWYAVVTRGNIERFMPPFASLTDQERWDVVAYALTLHVSEKELQRGRELFETLCADCPTQPFQNQEWMASLSNEELAAWLMTGSADFPALESRLTEGGKYELAAFVRTLSFASSPTVAAAAPASTLAAPEATPSAPAVVSDTPPPGAGTSAAEATPSTEAGSPTVTPEAAATANETGRASGSIRGANAAGLTVTLRGFDHASDAGGPQEAVTLTAVANADGNYIFENLEMPAGRIYLAETVYQGVTYGSDLAVVEAGAREVTLPPLTVYETTTDFSAIRFDQVHFFVGIENGNVQVIGVYTFSNAGTQTIVIESTADVPFLKMPAGAQNIGYELTQDSASLLKAEKGFAIPPSETAYGMVAFYTLPYEGRARIAQPFVLPASSVLLLVPEGVKVKSDQLTAGETRNFQGANYREYRGGALQGGETLTLDLSGAPKAASAANSRQNLLLGVGVFGAALILAGAWMYWRDRRRPDEEEFGDEDEFETEEEILDAIIALDDLHRAGKIPDEAYHARREELKARLKA